MATDFLQQYTSIIEFTFKLYEKYLVLCPEDTWDENFGGWPICLQYYHALAGTGGMIASISGIVADNPAPRSSDLGDSLDNPPSAEDAKIYLLNIIKAFDSTKAKLNDEELLKRNDKMSEKLGRDFSNAETLELIACHMQYHLGPCDGALRAKGLPAAF